MVLQQYGTLVNYKDKLLSVKTVGEGKKVLVLLPGFASPSPVIEFKALSNCLVKEYKIITIEYLGYGQSDIPDTSRTLENITDELHHTINSLGYSKYTLVAHSVSGIYCLYYANQYPNEIEAYIGIDSSVPQQIDSAASKAENSKMLQARKSKHSRFSKLIIKKSAEYRLKSCKDYVYSKLDLRAYSGLQVEYINRESLIDELEHFDETFNKLKEVRLPSTIPTLFLISDLTVKLLPQWKNWHIELLGNSTGKVILIHGNHYLHLTATKQVAEEIDNFIKLIG